MAMFAALAILLGERGRRGHHHVHLARDPARWSEMLPVGAVVDHRRADLLRDPARPPERPWYVNLAFGVAFTGIAIAIGMYIGARRELLASLKDRAERAEREQALRVARAQAEERTRIAREMHDVLAHRMSLVAMHAGALAYRDDLTPEETRTPRRSSRRTRIEP